MWKEADYTMLFSEKISVLVMMYMVVYLAVQREIHANILSA